MLQSKEEEEEAVATYKLTGRVPDMREDLPSCRCPSEIELFASCDARAAARMQS